MIKTSALKLFCYAIALAFCILLYSPLAVRAQKPELVEFSEREAMSHRIGAAGRIHTNGTVEIFSSVTLQVVVTPLGNVESARGISGPKAFYSEAEEMEMRREFTPFEKNGVPVRASIHDYVLVLPTEEWAAKKVPFPEIKDWNSLRITLKRTSCFGSCPAYSVEIQGDGTVTFNGGSFCLIAGQHHAKISRDDVENLMNQFRAANYFSAKDKYETGITDNPTYTTSIKFDSHDKQVIDYVGLQSGMPEAISALELGIDRAVEAGKWVDETDRTWPSLLAENWDFTAQTKENQALFASVIARGSPDLVQKFVASGAIPLDLARNGLDALASAAAKGNATLVAQMLSGHDHMPPRLLFRALWEAAHSGNVETVDVLLAKGADVNGGSGEIDGVETVLMAAARSGKAGVVNEILKYHPDVGKKDSAGDSALSSFLRDSNTHSDTVEIIQALIGAGADVNSRDNEGKTPIFNACFNASAVKPLAAAGADLNAKDNNGATPIMMCVFPEFFKAMIAAGADLSVQNKHGQTAAQWFRKQGMKEQADLLDAAMKTKIQR